MAPVLAALWPWPFKSDWSGRNRCGMMPGLPERLPLAIFQPRFLHFRRPRNDCALRMKMTPKPVTTAAKPRSVRRIVLVGCVIGLALATTAEAARVLLGRNFHTVVPG